MDMQQRNAGMSWMYLVWPFLYHFQQYAVINLSEPLGEADTRCLGPRGGPRGNGEQSVTATASPPASKFCHPCQLLPEQRRIDLVEVKCCKNTGPKNQLEASKQQHRNLYCHISRASAQLMWECLGPGNPGYGRERFLSLCPESQRGFAVGPGVSVYGSAKSMGPIGWHGYGSLLGELPGLCMVELI
eukprot:1162007-Pelagomonas_calceolata.AAC.8